MGTTRVKLVVLVISLVLMFGNSNFAVGYSEDPLKGLGPIDIINRAGILKDFNLNLPFNLQDRVDVKTVSNKLQNTSSAPAGSDINIKDISILVIEIFLVLMSIASYILKLILGFLK